MRSSTVSMKEDYTVKQTNKQKNNINMFKRQQCSQGRDNKARKKLHNSHGELQESQESSSRELCSLGYSSHCIAVSYLFSWKASWGPLTDLFSSGYILNLGHGLWVSKVLWNKLFWLPTLLQYFAVAKWLRSFLELRVSINDSDVDRQPIHAYVANTADLSWPSFKWNQNKAFKKIEVKTQDVKAEDTKHEFLFWTVTLHI